MTKAELELIKGVIDAVSGFGKNLADLQRFVLSIHTYLSEQPTYDAKRFAAIHQDYATDALGQLQKDLAASEARLRASEDVLVETLRNFEGPKH
jgi:hypothetical protein